MATKQLGWVRVVITVGMAAFATPALAADERIHYSACTQDWGSTGVMFGGGNNSTTNSLQIACPIPSPSALPHWGITGVYYYDEDNTTTGSVMVSRCVSFQNTNGGACGDAVFGSHAGTGVSAIAVPNTPAGFAAHWNWGHFPYLLAFIPPKTAGGAMSKIKGYYVHN